MKDAKHKALGLMVGLEDIYIYEAYIKTSTK